jgi:hypothetical protein
MVVTLKERVKRVKGWETKDLTLEQVIALRKIQRDERVTGARLAAIIGVPRSTFNRALLGHSIWIVDAEKIINWLEQRKPIPPEAA